MSPWTTLLLLFLFYIAIPAVIAVEILR